MELYIIQTLRRELESKQLLLPHGSNSSKINSPSRNHLLFSCPEPPTSPYRNTVKSRVSVIPNYQYTTAAPKPADVVLESRSNVKLARSMSESSASPSRINNKLDNNATVAKMMLQNIEQFKMSYVK